MGPQLLLAVALRCTLPVNCCGTDRLGNGAAGPPHEVADRLLRRLLGSEAVSQARFGVIEWLKWRQPGPKDFRGDPRRGDFFGSR